MKEYLVTCIHKPHHSSAHEHISRIGNSRDNWCMTRESAIRRIDAGDERYFTIDARTGQRAYIGVVRPAGRDPYLRTHADGHWNDNLLAQPECTADCDLVG